MAEAEAEDVEAGHGKVITMAPNDQMLVAKPVSQRNQLNPQGISRKRRV